MLATTGRLLAAHWPALLAWYLAGTLARYVCIQIAGFVGAYSDIGGVLLQPLAPLSRLVAYVAMLLIVRDGLRHLGVLAPRPEEPAERRRDFGRALLGGTVPFVAFYTAYNYLREDWVDFAERALDQRKQHAFENVDWGFTVGDLVLSPLSITLIVVAFAARWFLGRERAKKRLWLTPVLVYLEALWVVLTALVLFDLLGLVTEWAEGRIAWVWLADAREWLAGVLFPLVWLGDGLVWLIGEVGGVILLPLAWLTVAGAIYGKAVSADAPQLSGTPIDRTVARYRALRGPIRRALDDLWKQVTQRFAPIGKAIVLMWRAGPLLIAGYVLLFTVLLPLEPALAWVVTRIVGPQSLTGFWVVLSESLFLIPPLIIEPLRIAIVAAAYDATLTRLAPDAPAARPAAQAGGDAAPVSARP